MTSGAGGELESQIRRYLDHLAVERGAAKNTLSSYGRDLTRYQGYLVSRSITDLAEVTEEDVREFLVALRRGDPDRDETPLADSSVARTLVATRGLHKFALAEGMTTTDPAHRAVAFVGWLRAGFEARSGVGIGAAGQGRGGG